MNLSLRSESLCAAFFALSAPGIASAAPITVTQLTSSSQLSASDTAFVDPDPVGKIYAGPSVSFSTPGGGITFSRSSGAYEVDQVGYTYGTSGFANGTKLLTAGGYQGAGSGGPITLTFGTAVSQFGLNIEEFNTGPYVVSFSAFDVAGSSLGTFTAAGNDPNLLSFEGLSVSGDSISRVVFSDSAAGGSNNLAFGNVQFGSPQTAPAVTPEPSSFLLLGTGLLGVVGAARRKLTSRA